MTARPAGTSVRAAAVAVCVAALSACGPPSTTVQPWTAAPQPSAAPSGASPAPSGSPMPTTQPSAAASPAGTTAIADWARLPDPFGKAAGGELDAVAANQGGFLAVGSTGGATPAGVAISSADGLSWSAPVNLPGGTNAYVDAVAVGPDLIVAAGSSSGCCGQAGGKALVWTSRDGSTWKQVADQAGFANAGISGVTAVGKGFVAVGIANTTESSNDAAFWFSPDGASWSRLTSVPGLKTGWMHGVTAGTAGIVAIGTRGDPNTGPSAAWTSTDGKSWKLAAASKALASGVMRAVAPVGDGFVAVGYDADGHARVWRSSDGAAWTPDATQPASSGSGAGLDDLASVGTQLVGLEQVSSSDDLTAGVVWTWSASAGWATVQTGTVFADVGAASGALHAAVSTAGRIVVVGYAGKPDAAEPAIWVSPPGPS